MSKKSAVDIRQQLKNIFKGYGHITRKIHQELAALGFIVKSGKTHAKVYYGADHSRFVTISKTSSDRRAGRNICRQINMLLSVNA